MAKKCCVKDCRGNYDDVKKTSVFRFPQDPNENERWGKAIPRDNISNRMTQWFVLHIGLTILNSKW